MHQQRIAILWKTCDLPLFTLFHCVFLLGFTFSNSSTFLMQSLNWNTTFSGFLWDGQQIYWRTKKDFHSVCFKRGWPQPAIPKWIERINSERISRHTKGKFKLFSLDSIVPGSLQKFTNATKCLPRDMSDKVLYYMEAGCTSLQKVLSFKGIKSQALLAYITVTSILLFL